jgi:hypothetical protein
LTARIAPRGSASRGNRPYGADPSVLGSTFVVEGHPFTVIGVAAPEFFGETVRADPPDLWIPLQQEPMIAGGGSL